VVLENGRIVERGRHALLRDAGGLYADLWEGLVRDHGPAAPIAD
jgi:ABC-type multidrug transport system fused ATPase/permease subunit